MTPSRSMYVHPFTRWRLLGLGPGLPGVAVPAGGHPDSGWWAVAGTLAAVLSSIAYSALILAEPITGPELAGLALILAGVALGSGTLGLRRPATAEIPG